MFKQALLKLAALAGLLAAGAAPAQVDNVDPNQAVNSYQPGPQQPAEAQAEAEYQSVDPGAQAASEATATTAPPVVRPAPAVSRVQDTVERDDLFTAAEGVFGQGAEGLAGLLEKILKEQGQPVAYIAGREAGGAFIAGVKYGSGTMRHKVEGDRAVFWTGPSVGFDWGADASKVFVLVYNLHDGQDLFKRFPAAEGKAYALGGFTASYLRRGDVVLIPVRLGVGLRLGANVGYMRFSEKNRWMPF
jgi:hypothetical protein